MIAFIRAACGAVSTTRMPSVVNTSSKQPDELAVSVPDQESEVAGAIAQVEDQVAGLLCDPADGWVRRDAQYVDLPRGVLDHGEAVQSREHDRLHAEEVTGQDPDAWALRN
jgi:hypothetical protein